MHQCVCLLSRCNSFVFLQHSKRVEKVVLPAQCTHYTSIGLTQPEHPNLLAIIDKHCELFPWDVSSWKKLLCQESVRIWMVQYQSENIAYLCIQSAADAVDILRLGVVEHWRRKKVAQFLLETLKQWALQHSHASITLEVRADNHAALALYAEAGYQKIGLRKEYYPVSKPSTSAAQQNEECLLISPDRVDAIIMQLAL